MSHSERSRNRTGVAGAIAMVLAALVLAALAPATLHAQGTLFVEGDSVGIGTETPDETLHVWGDQGEARVVVEETSATLASRQMLNLINNGAVVMKYINTGTGAIWKMNALIGGFTWSFGGSGENEGQLSPTGDLTITGSLTQGSSRAIKENIEPIEAQRVLEGVVDLPLSLWNYSRDESDARHLGPMAEDFRAAFALGRDDRHLAPGDTAGVALAAIQGLYEIVLDKETRIARLEADKALLEERLIALEATVGGLIPALPRSE